MKKSLFLAAAMLIGAASVASADELQFGYCNDVVSNNMGGLSAGQYIAAAIEIPAETAKHWDGYTLKAINVGFGDSKQRQLTLFLTNDIEAAPFYEQKVVAEHKDEWNMYDLTTPYQFTGETLYVGYYLKVTSSSDWPIGVDDDPSGASPYGDLLAVGSGKASMRENWQHYGETFGNVSLRIVIEGDNMPKNDGTVSGLTLPVVLKPGEPFDIAGRIYNRGVDAISTFDVAVSIADADVQTRTVTLEEPLASGVSTGFTVSGLTYDAEGIGLDVKVSVPEVNGAGNASAAAVVTASVDCSEYMWPRAIVCEEGTYLTCPNCPRGIVGLREMHKKYPETFIGIGVHTAQDQTSGMYVKEYQPIINLFTQFPMSVVNRAAAADPGFSTLEKVYDALQKPVFADVAVSAAYTDESKSKLDVTTMTTYGMDMSGVDYRIALVLTEDKCGPFIQLNNYADGKLGEMGGFEKLPYEAPVLLDHVARYVNNPYGEPETSVTSVSKGEVKTHTYTIDMPASISNRDNVKIVAMLVDNSTAAREIYTGKEIALAAALSGVENIIAGNDADAPVEYYNLQGVRVAEPAAGQVYIRRQGASATKVLFK